MSVIVVEFTTLDGVVEDPDGSGGTPAGGWAFRHGPDAVAGDKFRLGSLLDTGVLLFGRATWEQFAKLWPGRSGEFPDRLNAAAKLVATRTLHDVSAWQNSALLQGELAEAVAREERDVVVIGSVGIAQELARHGLVDEYRLLVFPSVAGTGRRLFVDAVDFHLVSTTRVGPAILSTYRTR
ncbi:MULTISPECIES: dihydrofolate reductase family protein [unclassified Amycolatopsis]|uniref:dihydrofolate reductase family protein n=1 Tax=unclassified Amycolatopsis TaxID=2618356 RepID=UPI002876CE80|nr:MULTISPECIES: dihydrofolate reductase family protein [unclassified Amycolatopsis]MDS0137174.1 dihydrofolate reductase family protein [Amycolatopsis sp. 505]MDS0143839.1 dihydrofolate reductase family protein [Amycolatopsis sp. CM201R]